jgi:hypothetical protein
LQIHQLAGDANPFVDLLGHDDEVRTRAFRSKLGLCGSIRELRLWGNRYHVHPLISLFQLQTIV